MFFRRIKLVLAFADLMNEIGLVFLQLSKSQTNFSALYWVRRITDALRVYRKQKNNFPEVVALASILGGKISNTTSQEFVNDTPSPPN